MRVIAPRTLREFWEKHERAEGPLRAWLEEAEGAKWLGPNDIKRAYRFADILPSNRVIFNISGNTFRLVVAIKYELGIIYVRFVGTHAEYDKIDANQV